MWPQCRMECRKDQIIKLYFSDGISENDLIAEMEENLGRNNVKFQKENVKLQEEKLKIQGENSKLLKEKLELQIENIESETKI